MKKELRIVTTKYIFIIWCIFITFNLFGQGIGVEYERDLTDIGRLYGISYHHRGAMLYTKNNFTLYCGEPLDYTDEPHITLRNNNLIVWQAPLEGELENYEPSCFFEHSSGYFGILDYRWSTGSYTVCRVNKITGNFEVIRQFEGYALNEINGTHGGNVILGGRIYSGEALLSVIDSAGNLLLTKTSNNTGGLWGHGVQQIEKTHDNGYIVSGYINENNNCGELLNKSWWVCKLDASLNVVWSKKYGNGNGSIEATKIAVLDNNEIVAITRTFCTDGNGGGIDNSGEGNRVVKLSSTGEVLINKVIDLDLSDFKKTHKDLLIDCKGHPTFLGINGGLLGFSYFISKYDENLEILPGQQSFFPTSTEDDIYSMHFQKGVDNSYLIYNFRRNNSNDTSFVIKTTLDSSCVENEAITVSIDKNKCGPRNATIEVPVRVKDYNNIAGLQLIISSSNNNIAEITGFSNINPNSGLSSIDFAIVDKKLILTYADTEHSLSDSSVLFTIKVLLKGAPNSSANLIFEGDLKALNGNGEVIDVIGEQGSVCILNGILISGNITNIKNKGIKDVNVGLTSGNSQIETVKTNNLGFYSFSNLVYGQNYKVKPFFNESLVLGVDISDLFILRRHLQGLSAFSSPYTYLAADLNKDKQIDVGDLFLLRRIMQGLTKELPNAEPSWRFVPKSYNFPNNGNPLSGVIPDALSYNPLVTDQINQHYIGVKYGDLDHSRISFTDPTTETRNSADVELRVTDSEGSPGSVISVDVTAGNFLNGAVMQFSLQWPIESLELVGVPSGSDLRFPGSTIFDMTQSSEGKLGFIWETDDFVNGTTLHPDSTAFVLKFKLKGVDGSVSTIQNSLHPKDAKYIDVTGATIPLIIKPGQVTIKKGAANLEISTEKGVRIYPNPSNGIIVIESDYGDIGNIEVYGADGKLIQKIDIGQEHTINISHLPPGNYIIKGKANKFPFAKKIAIHR